MPALAEILLGVGSLKVLLIGLFVKKNTLRWCYNSAGLVLIAAIISVYSQPLGLQITFEGLFISDAFSILMRMVILLSGGAVIVLGRLASSQEGLDYFELPVLLLLSITGMMVMVSAHDLMSLFVGIELNSLSIYILTAMRSKNPESSKAALKYFVLGSLSTGIFLYGCSLVYGFTGLTNFEMIERFFKTSDTLAQGLTLGLTVGIVFIIIGLSFKLALAPFHLWLPDIYQGTPTSITTFLATAPKISGIAVLIRILLGPFIGTINTWQPLIIGMAVLSMFIGSIAALTQPYLKKVIAYSSIGHMGFMIIGVATSTELGLEASITYSIFYLLMVLLFFSSLLYLFRQGIVIDKTVDLRGIRRSYPGIAFLLGFTLFSMAGIPPLPGFVPKFFILRAAVAQGNYVIAILLAIYSVIAAAYYLVILKTIFLDDNIEASNQGSSFCNKPNLGLILILFILIVGLIFLMVCPNSFLGFVHQAAMAVMY